MNEEFLKNIKNNFPIFKKKIYYLDNAAITHVPKSTIFSLINFYKKINSNVHRSAYFLSETATIEYEKSREKIAHFIGAEDKSQCIFTKNTTEGINLVANSYVKNIIKKNDEIIISEMEHHSNIVPWFMLSQELKIKIKIIPITKNGELDYNKFENLINEKTKFISLIHISNSIGTINDIKKIIEIAKKKNIKILIDGAQSLANEKINVKDLDCDFFVFSSHKCYGPNGLGVLYAKKDLLNIMKPYQGGGEMIKYVSFSNIIWNEIPYKFEAGTQPIANVIAFGQTIDFLKSINLDEINIYKKEILNYALIKLSEIKGVNIIGNPKNRSSILSFTLDNIHSHDFGTIASHNKVCVRTGHHCAMPIMKFYNISSSIRISLGIYNNKNDIDMLIKSILEAKKIFT